MISTICRLCAAALLATGLAAGAHAGPAADKAAEAEALVSQGKAGEALAAFDAAEDAFWSALPLQFRVSLFADSVAAYGKYEPRANATFGPGENVTVYLEPVGYGFVAAGGLFRVAFDTSLEIRTPGGLVLGKTDDFGKLVWSGRAKSREVHAAVSVSLPDLKPGKYELRLTLTDAVTAKSATVILPFAIAE
jgi:hypothetical protein